MGNIWDGLMNTLKPNRAAAPSRINEEEERRKLLAAQARVQLLDVRADMILNASSKKEGTDE